MKTTLTLTMMLFLLIFASACSSQKIVSTQIETKPTELSSTKTVLPEETTNPEATEISSEVEEIKPTPRTSLEASDPADFMLASGQYQLVELFAFW